MGAACISSSVELGNSNVIRHQVYYFLGTNIA